MSSQVAASVEDVALDKPQTNLAVVKKGSREDSKLKDEAVNELILGHRENGRKLARSMLRRWRVRMSPEEIDSIVDLTLCEAARRYCPNRGASFMTFFYYHLRGHLVRAVASAAQASNVFLAFAQSSGIDARDWARSAGEDFLRSVVPDHLLASSRDSETPEHVVLRKEKIRTCREACSKLDALEQEIIERSFSN